jgi:hypothetical protein
MTPCRCSDKQKFEYLREFSRKLSPIWCSLTLGKLIHDKNQKLKISCLTSFKRRDAELKYLFQSGLTLEMVMMILSTRMRLLLLPVLVCICHSNSIRIPGFWFKGTIYEVCWPQPHMSLFSVVTVLVFSNFRNSTEFVADDSTSTITDVLVIGKSNKGKEQLGECFSEKQVTRVLKMSWWWKPEI